MFVDACLLAGSSFLSTLPPLENDVSSLPKLPKIQAAAELLKQRKADGNTICLQYRQEDAVTDAYIEKYRKALSSVKHHVILRPNGDIGMLDFANVPSDGYKFMGQRLPDELFTYMSRGIIGPEVSQWRSSNELVERPPLDGGDSVAYQRLVSSGLMPLRTTTLELLSHSIHRFYSTTDLSVRHWFDDSERKLTMRGSTDPNSELAAWNVRLEQIGEGAYKLEVRSRCTNGVRV